VQSRASHSGRRAWRLPSRPGARLGWRPAVALFAVTVLVPTLAAPEAHALTGPPPTVSFDLSYHTLADTGGTDKAVGHVSHASTCTLTVAPKITPLPVSENCTSGQFLYVVNVPSNDTRKAKVYVFTLKVTGPGGSVSQTEDLTVNPVPPPQIRMFSANPSTVGYAGGAITLVGNESGADKCAISVTPSIKGLVKTPNCGSGEFYQNETIPKNPTGTAETYTFTFSATGIGGTSTAATTVTVDPVPPPVVSSFAATPPSVGWHGGAVQLGASVTNGTTCTLNAQPSLAGLPTSVACSGGSVSTSVTLPPNDTAGTVTYTFTLGATGPGGQGTGTATATVGPAPPPVIGSFAPTPGVIGGGGGQVSFSGSLTYAQTCILSANVTVPGLPSSTPCSSGTYADTVTLPPNTTTGTLSYLFTLQATGYGGQVTSTTTVLESSSSPPTVDSFTASPAQLPAVGGAVVLTAPVVAATSCTLTADNVVAGLQTTPPCVNGLMRESVTLPANASTSPVTYTFTLTASSPSGSTTAQVTVTVAATGAPDIGSLDATPLFLDSAGGQTAVAARVTGASTCAISAAPALSGLPASVDCSGGTYSQAVTLPADTGTQPVPYVLTLTATGAQGSASSQVTVTVEPPGAFAITSLSAEPNFLGPAGGQTTLSATVTGAATCAVSSAPAVTGLPAAVDCSGGTYSQPVTLPANTGAQPVAYVLTMTATATGGATVSATTTVVTEPPGGPAITSLTPTPTSLPSTGGNVAIAAGLSEDGLTCTLSSDMPVTGLPLTQACGSSGFSDTVAIPANTGSAPITYTFTLFVSGPDGTAVEQVSVTENIAPPAISAFTAAPTSLPSAGGPVTLDTTVTLASSCSVTSSPLVSGEPTPVPCNGSATVTLPANTTTQDATYTLTLTATGSGGTTTATATVTVVGIPAVISESGTLPGSETWSCTDAGAYLVNQVVVPAGATLVILPCTNVEVQGDGIEVSAGGQLEMGGPGPPVTVSAAGAAWTVAPDGGSTVQIDNTQITGGSYGLALGCAAQISVTASSFSQIADAAITHNDGGCTAGGPAVLTIENNTIGAAYWGIDEVLGAADWHVMIQGNTFTQAYFADVGVRVTTPVSLTITGNTFAGGDWGIKVVGSAAAGPSWGPTITANTFTAATGGLDIWLLSLDPSGVDMSGAGAGGCQTATGTNCFAPGANGELYLEADTVGSGETWTVSGATGAVMVLDNRSTSQYTGAVLVVDGTLDLADGLVVKVFDVQQYVCGAYCTDVGPSSAGIIVNGSLHVGGSAVAPVVFTSMNDNSIGGATGNGNPSTIDYAWAILAGAGSDVSVDHATFTWAAYGIDAGCAALLSVTNSSFTDLGDYALVESDGGCSGPGPPVTTLVGNTFSGAYWTVSLGLATPGWQVTVTGNTFTGGYDGDLKVSVGTPLTLIVTGNVFTGGSWGISVTGPGTGWGPSISGNTFGAAAGGMELSSLDPTGVNLSGTGSGGCDTTTGTNCFAGGQQVLLALDTVPSGETWTVSGASGAVLVLDNRSTPQYTGAVLTVNGTLDLTGGLVVKVFDVQRYVCGAYCTDIGPTSAGIDVLGTLDVQGSASAPVVFTSVNDNSVGGGTGNGTPTAIDYAWAIYAEPGSRVSVDHATFNWGSFGIDGGCAADLSVTNSSFADLGDYALAESDGGCQGPGPPVTTLAGNTFNGGYWTVSLGLDTPGWQVTITGNTFTGGYDGDLIVSVGASINLVVTQNVFTGGGWGINVTGYGPGWGPTITANTIGGGVGGGIELFSLDPTGVNLSGTGAGACDTTSGTNCLAGDQQVLLALDTVPVGETWTVSGASGAVLVLNNFGHNAVGPVLVIDGTLVLTGGLVVKTYDFQRYICAAYCTDVGPLSAGIDVFGTLDVGGSATAPVVFTSINDNSVGGGTGSGSPTTIDYSWAIDAEGGSVVSVDHATFTYGAYGIVAGCAAQISVTNSSFAADGDYGYGQGDGGCTSSGPAAVTLEGDTFGGGYWSVVLDLSSAPWAVLIEGNTFTGASYGDLNLSIGTSIVLVVTANVFTGGGSGITLAGYGPGWGPSITSNTFGAAVGGAAISLATVDPTGVNLSGTGAGGCDTSTGTNCLSGGEVLLAVETVPAGETWTVSGGSGAVLVLDNFSHNQVGPVLVVDGALTLTDGLVVKTYDQQNYFCWIGCVPTGPISAGIDVFGSLDVGGSATAPVVFTSMNDNSVGGGTGSGNPTTTDYAFAIDVEGGSNISVDHATFAYSTFGIDAGCAAQISVTNSTFGDIGTYGYRQGDGGCTNLGPAAVTLEGDTFGGGYWGAVLDLSNAPWGVLIENNTFTGSSSGDLNVSLGTPVNLLITANTFTGGGSGMVLSGGGPGTSDNPTITTNTFTSGLGGAAITMTGIGVSGLVLGGSTNSFEGTGAASAVVLWAANVPAGTTWEIATSPSETLELDTGPNAASYSLVDYGTIVVDAGSVINMVEYDVTSCNYYGCTTTSYALGIEVAPGAIFTINGSGAGSVLFDGIGPGNVGGPSDGGPGTYSVAVAGDDLAGPISVNGATFVDGGIGVLGGCGSHLSVTNSNFVSTGLDVTSNGSCTASGTIDVSSVDLANSGVAISGAGSYSITISYSDMASLSIEDQGTQAWTVTLIDDAIGDGGAALGGGALTASVKYSSFGGPLTDNGSTAFSFSSGTLTMTQSQVSSANSPLSLTGATASLDHDTVIGGIEAILVAGGTTALTSDPVSTELGAAVTATGSATFSALTGNTFSSQLGPAIYISSSDVGGVTLGANTFPAPPPSSDVVAAVELDQDTVGPTKSFVVGGSDPEVLIDNQLTDHGDVSVSAGAIIKIGPGGQGIIVKSGATLGVAGTSGVTVTKEDVTNQANFASLDSSQIGGILPEETVGAGNYTSAIVAYTGAVVSVFGGDFQDGTYAERLYNSCDPTATSSGSVTGGGGDNYTFNIGSGSFQSTVNLCDANQEAYCISLDGSLIAVEGNVQACIVHSMDGTQVGWEVSVSGGSTLTGDVTATANTLGQELPELESNLNTFHWGVDLGIMYQNSEDPTLGSGWSTTGNLNAGFDVDLGIVSLSVQSSVGVEISPNAGDKDYDWFIGVGEPADLSIGVDTSVDRNYTWYFPVSGNAASLINAVFLTLDTINPYSPSWGLLPF